jgi:hypothetical protein
MHLFMSQFKKKLKFDLSLMQSRGILDRLWGLRPSPSPIQWVRGVLYRAVKRPGREAGRSPPSSAEVKNAWSCPVCHRSSSWRGACFSKEISLLLALPLPHVNIHDEIKRRLNSGNACYYSVQNLLSSRLI